MAKELVTCGEGPDLDGISSAFAYVELLRAEGKDAQVGFSGSLQLDAKFFVDRLQLTLPPIPPDFDKVRIVDSSSIAYLPEAIQRSAEKVVEVIDHRRTNDVKADFPGIERVAIKLVGACATIIAEMLLRRSLSLPRDIATLLHAGIHSNTLKLNSGVTTHRDHAVVRALESKYQIDLSLVAEMFEFRTAVGEESLLAALQNDFQPNIESPDGLVGVAQIETTNAPRLLEKHKDLIQETLLAQKSRHQLDFAFLTLPSINEAINYIYAADRPSEEFVLTYLKHHLPNPHARHEGALSTDKLLLRKEILPMLLRFPPT